MQFDPSKRRQFTLLGGLAATWPFAVRAQNRRCAAVEFWSLFQAPPRAGAIASKA